MRRHLTEYDYVLKNEKGKILELRMEVEIIIGENRGRLT